MVRARKVIDIRGKVAESHKFACASRKNRAQLRNIYLIIANRRHKIRVNGETKNLEELKFEFTQSLKTLDKHLGTSTNDERHICIFSLFYKYYYYYITDMCKNTQKASLKTPGLKG